MLYSGAFVSRKHKFKVEIKVEHEVVGGENGVVSQEPKVELDVKERTKTVLIETSPVAGVFSKSDFPLYVFVSEGGKDGDGPSVICSSNKTLKTWRKLTDIDKKTFYETVSEPSTSDFSLPELDEEVYDTDKNEDMTKAGLLVPVWKLDVDENSFEEMYLSELLDLRTIDTFVLKDEFDENEDEEGDDGGEEDGGDDPCEEDDGVEEPDEDGKAGDPQTDGGGGSEEGVPEAGGYPDGPGEAIPC